MRRSDIAPPRNLRSGLPPGWIPCTLGELGHYRNGRGFKKAEWAESGRPIIRIQNLTGSGETFNYFRGETAPEHVVRDGDLLVSWAATLGVYFWRGPEAVLNQHIFRVDSFINRRFHALLIRGLTDDLYRRAHGSGMVHVTRGEFDGTPLLLPPEAEQRRIVDEVEKQFTRLDAAVASLQRIKANLKRYRASVLNAACEGRLVSTEAELARREGRSFESGEELLKRILKERRARWEADQLAKMKAAGKTPRDDAWKRKYEEPEHEAESPVTSLPEGWCSATLAQLSWSSGYGTSTKCAYVASGPPVLRIPNVEKACIDLDDVKCAIDPSALAGDDPLAPGDFLVVRTNGSRALIGRGALVREAFRNPHHFASYLIRFRLAERVFSSGWLSVVWQSPRVRAELEGKAATSAGQYNLSLTSLLPTQVPVPPLPEQHRIVAEVERRLSVVDELEATVEKNLARCARLRQSILKMAFEGRLVPQDPKDEPASALLERIRVGTQSGSTLGQSSQKAGRILGSRGRR